MTHSPLRLEPNTDVLIMASSASIGRKAVCNGLNALLRWSEEQGARLWIQFYNDKLYGDTFRMETPVVLDRMPDEGGPFESLGYVIPYVVTELAERLNAEHRQLAQVMVVSCAPSTFEPPHLNGRPLPCSMVVAPRSDEHSLNDWDGWLKQRIQTVAVEHHEAETLDVHREQQSLRDTLAQSGEGMPPLPTPRRGRL